jgi:molybdopterin-containing oxidoreductase family membrane subunit
MKNLKFMMWHLLLGILIAIGVYAVYMQEVQGHHITGISKEVPWGIYIAAFAFFVGISAGATIIGLLIYGFNKTEFKPIGIRAILVGIVSLLGAMIFIMMDLGMPFRALKIPWLLHNTSSMFFISSTSYYLFMIILLAELYLGLKILKGSATHRDKRLAKWIGILVVPYALLVVHMVTGFIFGVIKTREYWNTSLLPLHFIMSALASGTAIILLMVIISTYTHKFEKILGKGALSYLGFLLFNFIGITMLFDLADIVVLKYSEHPEGLEAWNILTTEHLDIFLINVLGLVLAFLILWFGNRKNKMVLGIASLLLLLSVAAYRYNLVIVPQEVPILDGIDRIQYVPTIFEIMICFGVISFVMLVYSIATKVLPIDATKIYQVPTDTVTDNESRHVYTPKESKV